MRSWFNYKFAFALLLAAALLFFFAWRSRRFSPAPTPSHQYMRIPPNYDQTPVYAWHPSCPEGWQLTQAPDRQHPDGKPLGKDDADDIATEEQHAATVTATPVLCQKIVGSR